MALRYQAWCLLLSHWWPGTHLGLLEVTSRGKGDINPLTALVAPMARGDEPVCWKLTPGSYTVLAGHRKGFQGTEGEPGPRLRKGSLLKGGRASGLEGAVCVQRPELRGKWQLVDQNCHLPPGRQLNLSLVHFLLERKRPQSLGWESGGISTFSLLSNPASINHQGLAFHPPFLDHPPFLSVLPQGFGWDLAPLLGSLKRHPPTTSGVFWLGPLRADVPSLGVECGD